MFREIGYNRILLLLMMFSLSLGATDQEANELFAEGRALEKKGKYSSAASDYMDARLMADSGVLKGNALIAAARAYRKAQLYGDEFDCLKKLVAEHINGINFTQVVDRMYKIGDLFFEGHRDVAVSWLPFIKKEDRTLEIYETALKYAPCAEQAADVRLRVARMYIDDQKPEEAIRHLREIPKLHPGTDSAKYAMLELCDLLLQVSERGDGDGSYSRQALEAFENYLKDYPDSPEVPWVMKARKRSATGSPAGFIPSGNTITGPANPISRKNIWRMSSRTIPIRIRRPPLKIFWPGLTRNMKSSRDRNSVMCLTRKTSRKAASLRKRIRF